MIMTDKTKENFGSFLIKEHNIASWECFDKLPLTCQNELIIDFFDSVGIFINIKSKYGQKKQCERFSYVVKNYNSGFIFNSRQEARVEAIKSANGIYKKLKMNNLFKQKSKVLLDNNWYMLSDSDSGIILVKHYPATRKNKDGVETDYTAEERFYYPTVAQTLERYVREKQIILPTVEEMLQVQKEVLAVLEDFSKKYSNWN